MDAVAGADICMAAECFWLAVQDDPAYVDALFNLGKACKDLGRWQDAADAFRRIVALFPGEAEAWYMLANTCHVLEGYDDARAAYEKVIALTPRDIRARVNLGVTLQAAGRADEALRVYAQALREHPMHADLHYNRALALLSSGAFAEGFAEFEWRFYTSDLTNPPPADSSPRWCGGPVSGKTILLKAEQGFGDTIQFARFIPEARRCCGGIVLECRKELVPLLRSMTAIDRIVEAQPEVELPHDCWAPLMSLPFLLAGRFDPGGESVPYLHVDAQRRMRWQRRLTSYSSKPNVGMVWAGNPAHRNDHHRSCPAEQFTPLVRQSGFRWLSLCKTSDGLLPAAWGGTVDDIAPELNDFADTAAALLCLDVLITVDTAAAHLAGALGKPVWLLLPFAPDWRWSRGTDRSVWYPSMRVFSQPRPGDWPAVIREVENALSHLHQNSGRQVPAPVESGESLEYANALRDAGLFDHAVQVYREIVRIRPGNLAAWNNLGITLQDGGNPAGAIDAFTAALGVDPGNAVVMNNLGFARLECGDVRGAEEVLRRGIAIDSNIADLHNNLGNALREQGEHREAESAYRRAIALQPEFAQAHWNLAQTLLQCGDFEEGWSEYEWRWRRADFTSPLRRFPQPQWRGEQIAGKTLLVHAEQGLGDALQFVRYVPLLAQQGIRVCLECHPELVRLFTSVEGVGAVSARGDALPGFDVHVPMMSIPRLLHKALRCLPAEVPYLGVPPEQEARWREALPVRPDHLRVGVAWSGSRHLRSLLSRACPLDELLPVFATEGCAFYSLQKGITDQERTLLGDQYGIQDIGSQVNDFADTAAAMRSLDLIISIDTSVAHLAGALGLPVWVLLPVNADWRWLLARNDSPWYPTMRLFRQETPGSWTGVVRDVCNALRGRVRDGKGGAR
jgi:tetratricopeptide (TPR) repeat protein